MSNFACEHCNAICSDSEYGYTTGCKHYPPDQRAVIKMIEAKVTKIIRDYLNIEYVDKGHNLIDDLKCNDSQIADMLLIVDIEFGIVFKPVKPINTVKDLIDSIKLLTDDKFTLH